MKMHSCVPSLSACAVAAALLLSAGVSQAGNISFSIQRWFVSADVGLRINRVNVAGINTHGEIAGSVSYDEGTAAFSVLAGQYFEFPDPRLVVSSATALSDDGMVFGSIRPRAAGAQTQTFIKRRGQSLEILDGIGLSAAAMDPTGTWIARQDHGSLPQALLGRLNSSFVSVGIGAITTVNRHGDFVRVPPQSTGSPAVSEVRRGGRSQTFTGLTFTHMNSAGDAVGFRSQNNTLGGSVLLRGDTVIELGPGQLGTRSGADAISDQGVIVGTDGSYATIYDPKRGFVRLEDVSPNLRGEFLWEANAVNEHHQIGGMGRSSGGYFAYVLTPGGTLRWDGGASGRFSDGASWDSGAGLTPSKFLDVELASAAHVRAVADRSVTMKSLTVGAGSGAAVARLELAAGARLVSTDAVVRVERQGLLTGQGTIGGPLVNLGTLGEAGGAAMALAVEGELENRGLVTGTGMVAAVLVNRGSGGLVRPDAGGRLHFQAGIHSNADGGRIEVRQGAELSFSGQFVNQGGAFVRIDDGTLRTGSLENGGLVQIGFGGASIFGDVVNNPATDPNRGRIVASGGADVTFWDRVVNRGEVRASAGSRILYFGAASGSGQFTTNGGGYHRFEGGFTATAAIGNGQADAVADALADAGSGASFGDVQFASTLALSLAGDAAVPLRFSGSVLFDLGSSLTVTLADGFVPSLGQSLRLFDYTLAPEGRFDALNLPALAPTLVWNTSGLYTSGLLAVQAVPEPGSWALMLGGAALLGGWMRRRARCDSGSAV